MNANNASERSQAFRSFLLLFTITVAVLVAAVFSSMQVPFKQNRQLLTELDSLKKQQDFAEDFIDVMEKTYHLLDTVNIQGVRSDLIDGTITYNINSMQTMINDKSSILNKKLYDNIIYTFASLQTAKRDIRKVSDQSSQNAGLQREIDKLQAANSSLTAQLNALALSSRQQGQPIK